MKNRQIAVIWGVLPKRGKSRDELGLDLSERRTTFPCTNCFIARASLSCSVLLRAMLCYTALARQAAPAAGLKLDLLFLFLLTALLRGLLLSGAVLWCVGCVGVPLVPLTHAVLGWCHGHGHTPEPDPCVQRVARCGPRAVHAAHVRARCHANGHMRRCLWLGVTTRTQPARVRTRTFLLSFINMQWVIFFSFFFINVLKTNQLFIYLFFGQM